MGVLSEVSMRLQNTEDLFPVIAVHREVDRETRGWDRLPPTAHHVILAESADDGLTIPLEPTPSIHRFLNALTVMALQANCAITYLGNNIFLPTAFFQDLLQDHILDITDPNAPTGLSLLLTPTYSVVPENAQQRAMRVQVLFAMG